MRHNDSRFPGAVQGFQNMQKPCIVAILFRRDTVPVKAVEFILSGFDAICPRFIRKRRIHDDEIKFLKLSMRIQIAGILQGIPAMDFSRSLLVKDQIHLGQAGCRAIFFLSKDRNKRIPIFIQRRFIDCPDK